MESSSFNHELPQEALAEPLCFVPPGNIQGGSADPLGFNPPGNLWNGVTPQLWHVFSWLMGSCGKPAAREGSLLTAELAKVWKQHNSQDMTENKTFPEVQQPPCVNSSLCPVSHCKNWIWGWALPALSCSSLAFRLVFASMPRFDSVQICVCRCLS